MSDIVIGDRLTYDTCGCERCTEWLKTRLGWSDNVVEWTIKVDQLPTSQGSAT